MGKRPTARFVNGVLAAVITVAFIAHALLGGFSSITGYAGVLVWLIWGAVVLAGAHVVASIVTSNQQLTDTEFPPSARKKRHLALKWVTGGLLAAIACVHIVLPRESWTAVLVVVALSAAIAVHVCVGSKSLLKDLEIDRKYKTSFRVVVCAFVAIAVIAMIIGKWGM